MTTLQQAKIGGEAKFKDITETKDRIIIKLEFINPQVKDKNMEIALSKELLLSELFYEIYDDKYKEMIRRISQGKNILDDKDARTALLRVLDGSKLNWMFSK